MKFPDIAMDDSSAFDSLSEVALHHSTNDEISDAVARAARFLEEVIVEVPRPSWARTGDVPTHAGNATALMCAAVRELIKRQA